MKLTQRILNDGKNANHLQILDTWKYIREKTIFSLTWLPQTKPGVSRERSARVRNDTQSTLLVRKRLNERAQGEIHASSLFYLLWCHPQIVLSSWAYFYPNVLDR